MEDLQRRLKKSGNTVVLHLNHRGRERRADPQERFLRKLWGKGRDGMKRCVRCGIERPIDQFHKQRRMRDGRSSWCRPCLKKYHKLRAYTGILDVERLVKAVETAKSI